MKTHAKISTLSFLLLFLITGINLQAQNPTVVLGGLEWMTTNLDVMTFRNGDEIPEVKTAKEWKKAGESGTPAWCYYENSETYGLFNGDVKGRLYNWYALTDPRGLAPEGWRIPEKADWDKIINLYGDNRAGLYNDLIKGGSTGFNVILAGRRHPKGEFEYFETYTTLWTSSLTDDGKSTYYVEFNPQWPIAGLREGMKGTGNYVRCIKEK